MIDWLLETLGTHGLAIIFLVMAAGAALQGSVGYGMALIASPILILVEPKLIPGPYLLGSLLLSVFMILRERKAIDLRGLKWALVGRIPGTILAGYLLAIISEEAMILTFGILLLLGVAISVAGIRFPPRPRNLVFAGLLSAVMGTIATIGGPPMALVYQDANGEELRSTLSGYFIIGGLFSIVTLAAVGKFGAAELWLAAAIVPGTVFGYLVSSWLLPHLNHQLTRASVLVVAAVSALVVILRVVV
jgi:uncharacterized membrane protein YfcA